MDVIFRFADDQTASPDEGQSPIIEDQSATPNRGQSLMIDNQSASLHRDQSPIIEGQSTSLDEGQPSSSEINDLDSRTQLRGMLNVMKALLIYKFSAEEMNECLTLYHTAKFKIYPK